MTIDDPFADLIPDAPGLSGSLRIVGKAKARGIDAVDSRLVHILDEAAKDYPYQVELFSGLRPGDPRQHGHGKATDIRLVDRATKQALPDYQDANSFRAYEDFAQRARSHQQRLYPELNQAFRWGGYFSGPRGKDGALDLMHFDLGGSDHLGMAGGSWEGGLTEQQRRLFPAAQSRGMKPAASMPEKVLDFLMPAAAADEPKPDDNLGPFGDLVPTGDGGVSARPAASGPMLKGADSAPGEADPFADLIPQAAPGASSTSARALGGSSAVAGQAAPDDSLSLVVPDSGSPPSTATFLPPPTAAKDLPLLPLDQARKALQDFGPLGQYIARGLPRSELAARQAAETPGARLPHAVLDDFAQGKGFSPAEFAGVLEALRRGQVENPEAVQALVAARLPRAYLDAVSNAMAVHEAEREALNAPPSPVASALPGGKVGLHLAGKAVDAATLGLAQPQVPLSGQADIDRLLQASRVAQGQIGQGLDQRFPVASAAAELVGGVGPYLGAAKVLRAFRAARGLPDVAPGAEGAIAEGAKLGAGLETLRRPEGADKMTRGQELQARALQGLTGVATGALLDFGVMGLGEFQATLKGAMADRRYRAALLDEARHAGFDSTEEYLSGLVDVQQTPDGLVIRPGREILDKLPGEKNRVSEVDQQSAGELAGESTVPGDAASGERVGPIEAGPGKTAGLADTPESAAAAASQEGAAAPAEPAAPSWRGLAQEADELERLAHTTESPRLRQQLLQDALSRRTESEAIRLGVAPKLTPTERARRNKIIEPERDDLITAIRKLGGIDVTFESDWAGRLSHLPKTGFGLPAVEQVTGRGRTLDDLAESLHDLGYLAGRDVRELEDRLSIAETGQPVWAYTKQDYEAPTRAPREPRAAPIEPGFAADPYGMGARRVGDEWAQEPGQAVQGEAGGGFEPRIAEREAALNGLADGEGSALIERLAQQEAPDAEILRALDEAIAARQAGGAPGRAQDFPGARAPGDRAGPGEPGRVDQSLQGNSNGSEERQQGQGRRQEEVLAGGLGPVPAGAGSGTRQGADLAAMHDFRIDEASRAYTGGVYFSKHSILPEGKQPKGISHAEAQRAVDDFKQGLSGATGLDFRIHDDLDSVLGPGHGIGGRVKGFFLPKSRTVVLLRGAHDSVPDAVATLRHETLAHYGLNLLDPVSKRTILDRIANSRDMPGLAGLFKAVEKEYPELISRPSMIAEEVFARVAEKTPGALRQWWDGVLTALARGLRKIGLLRGQMTHAELSRLAESIAEGIRRSAPQRTFPKDNQSQFRKQDTDEPALQTESKAFKEWFGNSKVVDEHGKPLRVYHATSADFDVFDMSKSVDRFGMHFGSKEAAGDVGKSRGSVMPVYLRIEQPFRYRDSQAAGGLLRVSHLLPSVRDNLAKIGERGTFSKFKEMEDISRDWSISKVEQIEKAKAKLAEWGFDGLVYKNEFEGKGEDSYVVFSPNQVKSAIGNSGDFSLDSPSILYANPFLMGAAQLARDVGLDVRAAPRRAAAQVALGAAVGGLASEDEPGSAKWWLDLAKGGALAKLIGTKAPPLLRAMDHLPLIGRGPEDLRALKKRQQLMRQVLDRQTAEVGKFLEKHFSPAERAMMADLIESRGIVPELNLIHRQAGELDAYLSYAGARLRQLGMLPADMELGGYLHRYYSKHLEAQGLLNRAKNWKQSLSGSYTLARGTEDGFRREHFSPGAQAILREYEEARARLDKLEQKGRSVHPLDNAATPAFKPEKEITALYEAIGQHEEALRKAGRDSPQAAFLLGKIDDARARIEALRAMPATPGKRATATEIPDIFGGEEARALEARLKELRQVEMVEYLGQEGGKPRSYLFLRDEVPVVPGRPSQAIRPGRDGRNVEDRALLRQGAAWDSAPGAELAGTGRVWSVRGVDADRAVLHRDWTEAERRAWGEIKDAGYRYVRGMAEASHDIALATLFETVARRADWVASEAREGWHEVPASKVGGGSPMRKYGALAGKWVRPDVWAGIQGYGRSPLGNHPIVQVYRNALAQWKLWHTADNPVTHFNNLHSNAQMLYLAGYGPRDLADAIGHMRQGEASKLWTEARDAGLFGTDWTASILADEGGAARGLMDLAESLRTQPEIPDAAATVAKLLDVKRWWLESKAAVAGAEGAWNTGAEVLRAMAKPAVGAVARPYGAYARMMRRAYQFEDDLFKLAVYSAERGRGAAPDRAAEVAGQYFFDYYDVPQAVRLVRDLPIGAPFISYTYLAAQSMAKNLVERPGRMLALLAGYEALNYAVVAASEDGAAPGQYWAMDRAEDALSSPADRGRALIGLRNMIHLPSPEGYRLALGRAHVLGNPFANEAGGKEKNPPLPVVGQIWGPSWFGANPFLGLAVDVLSNEDWKGKPIYHPADPDGVKTAKIAAYLAQGLGPSSPVVPGSYHQRRILEGMANDAADARREGRNSLAVPVVDAANAALEALGLEQLTGLDRAENPIQTRDALLGAVGIKLRPAHFDQGLDFALGKLQAQRREAQDRFRKEQRKRGESRITESQMDEAQAIFQRELEDIQAEEEKLFRTEDVLRKAGKL